MNTIQIDYKVIQILNITEISRFICDTNKGTLKLKLLKGSQNYIFTLDSYELDKNTNKELMDLLFPKPIVEPVIPKVEKKTEDKPKKKAGRPKKNAKV